MSGAFHALPFDEYAFDVDYSSSSALFLSVAGTQRATGRADESAKVLHGSLTVVDVLNETPNTCTFRTMGFAPQVGQRVIISLGGIANPSRLFAGTILTCQQSYEGTPGFGLYDVSCADDTWKLGQIKVSKRYTAESATDIAIDLIDTYAPDFDTTDIEAALDDIDEITFTNETLSTCLTRLAQRIGGYWYVDEFESIHFFVTDTATDPDALEDANPPLNQPAFTIDRDISQMITRVLGEGNGAEVLADVAVGETLLPVRSVEYFNPLGGIFVSGPQRCTYAGVAGEGIPGALVGTGAAPNSALAGVLADGAGVEDGAHSWAYTYVTGAGETIPSPLLDLTVGSVAAPTGAPTAGSPTVGSGVTTGDHYYAITFVTAVGETTGSPVSLTVSPGPITTGLINAPASAPTLALGSGGGGTTSKTISYAATFTNAAGETTAGPSASLATTGYDSTVAGSFATQDLGSGGIAAGNYGWVFTIVTADGETEFEGAAQYGISTGSTFNALVGFSSLAAIGANVTALKIWRTTANADQGVRTNYGLVTTITNTAQTSFLDNVPDGSLGGSNPPATNTTYRQINLSSIPIGPSGTTGRKVYATEPGGSQLKLLATLANNTTTTSTDTNPVNTARLGANVPTSNTTSSTVNYNVVPLSSIPIGPANCTARRVYRTAAGGAQLKLVATIANNSATTYSDTTADGSLGANIPVSNTADANQVSLTAISVGPSGTTSRKVYRTVAAGSQLKLLATIADNTTTTYTDSTADASLGANVPTSDTSGLTQPAGQVLPGAIEVPVAGAGALPAAGWAVIGNGQQTIRYTGNTGAKVTGVPASGAGSITAAVAFNSTITASPMLTGIPSSSDGSILYAITKGDPANLFIIEDDVAAQAELAAAIGSGDGVVEEFIQDRRLSETELRARAVAVLARRARVDASITYAIGGKTDPGCRDHRSGRTIVIDLPDMNVDDSFKIQRVSITNFQPALEPVFRVEASTNRFSFEDLLRQGRSGGASP